MLRTALATAIVFALAGCASTPTSQPLKADGLRGKLKFEVVNGEYFVDRYTYPTGNFDARWVLDAEKQYQRVPTGTPQGAFEANRSQSLNLPAGQMV